MANNPFDALLEDDDPTPGAQQRAQQLGAALRRDSDFGTLFQLMGTEATKQAGETLNRNAYGGLQMAVEKQLKGKEARMRADERRQAQENWQRSFDADVANRAEQRRQFGITEQRLRDAEANELRKKYQAMLDPNTGMGRIFNTVTGRWKDEEDAEAAGRPTVGPDGRPVVPWPSQPGAGAQPGAGPVGASPLVRPVGKPPSESESKSGMRGAGTTDALSAAQDIIARNPGAARPGWIETGATLIGLSPEQQQLVTQAAGGADRGVVRSAMEGAVDAALTEMTGAAYTPVQLATYRARFMPTILDDRASRVAKAQQMIDFVRQQSVAAGRAWTPEREQQLLTLIGKMNQGFDQQERGGGIPTQPQVPQGPRPGDAYLPPQ